ncbi:CGNR zinc finger domain-containing protein [Psychromonas ossibalaenae]|uniref:CGNR zinc finger domain-containing protein n=1 Tax=Psychromonas ossibalaenae TaxID=444922 RepID=UPI00037695B3|nr:CGNR zinc finger domain-containing protein [Psychromonas ossibalaenae]
MFTEKLRIGSPPAPESLVLVEGFLNTWSGELNIDDFKTPHSTEEWLRSVELWVSEEHITPEQTQKIIQFRSDLRTWILDSESRKSLDALASEISFQVNFNADGEVRFTSTGDPYHRAIGTLIEIIGESQKNGTWDRFKCCALPTCGWAFYDSTRSRTKRWCSMQTCGSRHKSREHYKRKQQSDIEK